MNKNHDWSNILNELQTYNYDDSAFLYKIFDAIPVGMFYKDINLIYRYCNDAFLQYTGLERDKVIGHTAYDVSPNQLANIYNNSDIDMIKNGVKTQYYEAKLKKNNEGKLHDVVFSKALVLENTKVVGIVGIIHDITEQKKRGDEMEYLSNHDDMTGLFNRRYFKEKLKESTIKNLNFSLICIDLNKLKFINDTYGHLKGDNYITAFSKDLINKFKTPNIASRIGGDEFNIICFEKNIDIIINKLKQLLQHCDFSYGIAEFPIDSKSPKNLIKIADNRMYKQKYEQKYSKTIRNIQL